MKLLFTLLTLFFVFEASAQQEKAEWNGKSYFVYPYQQEVDISMRNLLYGVKFKEEIERDSLNRNIISVKEKKVPYTIPFPNTSSFKKTRKQFLEIRSIYPYILYGITLPLESDITPVLQPLPDGEYIQYYRDLPYVDGNVLRYRNDVVCAVFTLKDNRLSGNATWFAANGSTVKTGNFTDGLKTGAWKHFTYFFAPPVKEFYVDRAVKGDYTDTILIQVNYLNGLLNGAYSQSENQLITETGSYKNGEPSGDWAEYVQKSKREGIKTIMLPETVLIKKYRIAEKPVAGKGVIIRNRIVNERDIDRREFNIPYDNFFEPFSSYYSLYEEEEEEGLELAEEKVNSYPGEEDYSYSGYNDLSEIDFSYSGISERYDIRNKSYSRNDLIDSVGYSFFTEGIYEEFHDNGQLKLRFEVRDGKLVSEDTVFYDNGSPASVIEFNAAKNEYLEKTFDYDNKPISVILYDQKGNFVKYLDGEYDRYNRSIRGKKYNGTEFSDIFTYDNRDTLKNLLNSEVMIEESLWAFDSTTASTTNFDPLKAQYKYEVYSLGRDTVRVMKLDFSDNYSNFTGTDVYKAGDLEVRTLMNGSYYSSPFLPADDSVPSSRVENWWRNYQIDDESILYHENVPYTGSFSLTANASDFSFAESKNAISLSVSHSKSHSRAIERAVLKAKKKKNPGKLKDYITEVSLNERDAGSNLLYSIIPFIGDIFEPVFEDFFLRYDETERGSREYYISEKKAPAFDKSVKGNFLNGKPEGQWTTYDQYGNITTKVTYVNGVVQGETYQYKTAFPADPKDIEYRFMNPILKDTLPEKPVHYLSRKANYKDGLLSGNAVEFNWLGDTMALTGYELNMRQGPSFEKTKLVQIFSAYDQDEVEGISRTYLTLSGKEPSLLFDLNFQDGMLQGESKSYHLNGKLAKHGFFLYGQPIDDFEAYDTLGFKYQYVKFQYNQPVEEKIWEENELSVKYTFDWRDSIYFNTADIAGSQSLDELIGDLGLAEDMYERPYYGRPSLVDKSGIDYHMTKYYPNDIMARDGDISKGKKTGCWQFWNYEGRKLYEVDYFDTIITVDSVRFKSKGILTQLDEKGNNIFKSYIVEKVEKYDCSHTDHHEVRMLITIWERDSSVHRMNGYIKNYYDNGVLQNEGYVKNGVATGVWKFYDPYGSLSMVGEYKSGKRDGRWLKGDLSNVKYMGDICLNPNMQNLEEILSYQEKLLDISVIYYQTGVVKKSEYYGVNLNNSGPPDNYFGEEIELK